MFARASMIAFGASVVAGGLVSDKPKRLAPGGGLPAGVVDSSISGEIQIRHTNQSKYLRYSKFIRIRFIGIRKTYFGGLEH
jgi:hypothetical protein